MNALLGFPEGGSTLPFGHVLRHCRDARHLSQLALATEAGISTRHLSFLELSFFSVITTFATPQDVALQQLKIDAPSRQTRRPNRPRAGSRRPRRSWSPALSRQSVVVMLPLW